jgi:hypothetical protein
MSLPSLHSFPDCSRAGLHGPSVEFPGVCARVRERACMRARVCVRAFVRGGWASVQSDILVRIRHVTIPKLCCDAVGWEKYCRGGEAFGTKSHSMSKAKIAVCSTHVCR